MAYFLKHNMNHQEDYIIYSNHNDDFIIIHIPEDKSKRKYIDFLYQNDNDNSKYSGRFMLYSKSYFQKVPQKVQNLVEKAFSNMIGQDFHIFLSK